jgi:hypothetical protein
VTVDLFAASRCRDYQRALARYERLLGSQPAFLPTQAHADACAVVTRSPAPAIVITA